jgi:outer membrane receptor protein involved in Fe transport
VNRTENRIQREASAAGRATQDLDEDYDALVTRVAAYAQDDWQISDRVSAYLGLRWEGLMTRTWGHTLSPVRSRSSVFSPTFQWLWKIPESKSDQLRVSLSRTYKAPTARELIPRRWVVTDNSATSPNFQGNPELVPELAWGVDIGYERHLADNGFFGVSAYARNVRNVVLQRTFVDPDGVWISSPFNGGNAIVRGIEVEGRSKLPSLWTGASDVEVRAGVTRNLSRVKQVPSPGNRLNQQPSLTVSLGADYRPAQTPLTIGASFLFEKGDFFRSSETQSGRGPFKRNLDAYGLWALGKDTKFRLTFANLLKTPSVNTVLYDDVHLHQVRRVEAQSFVTIRLGIELRL